MKSNIKIEYKSKHQIGGTIGDNAFTIKWNEGKVVDGTCFISGVNKIGITYLSISKNSSKIGGNPMLPSNSTTMQTFARFQDGEWEILNSGYIGIVSDLIKYIYKIKSFSLV